MTTAETNQPIAASRAIASAMPSTSSPAAIATSIFCARLTVPGKVPADHATFVHRAADRGIPRAADRESPPRATTGDEPARSVGAMLSNTQRKAAIAVLIAGPLVTLAGMLTTPWEKDTTTVSYHDALAAHPGQSIVAAILLHFGYLLLLPAALALYVLARQAAPKLATAGGILALIGLSTLPGLLVTDFYDLAMAQALPHEQSAAIADSLSAAGMVAIAVPSIAGTVFGLTLLGAAAWRAGYARGWAPAAILVGWLFPLASGTGLVPAAAGATLLALGSVALRLAQPRLRANSPKIASASAA